MLVVMSHELSDKQIREAKEDLNIDTIITMPEDVKCIWGNISPEGSLPIREANKIIEWIEKKSEEGDYVLVQGDFGSTYYVVSYCFIKGRIPIYATNHRVVQEKKEGGVTITNRIFKHVNFRKYYSYD